MITMASKQLSTEQQNSLVECVHIIKLALKDILRSQIGPEDLYHSINSEKLKGRHYKLNEKHRRICFSSFPPDYDQFDVYLLYILIRNLCEEIIPTGGWAKFGNRPKSEGKKIGDDIERLMNLRFWIYAQLESLPIPHTEFASNIKELQSILERTQVFLSSCRCSVHYEEKIEELTIIGKTFLHFGGKGEEPEVAKEVESDEEEYDGKEEEYEEKREESDGKEEESEREGEDSEGKEEESEIKVEESEGKEEDSEAKEEESEEKVEESEGKEEDSEAKEEESEECTTDAKAVLGEFERWFRGKYVHIKIVHLYRGKQMHNCWKDALVVVIDHFRIIDEKVFKCFGTNFDIYCKLWKNTSSECMLVSKFEHESGGIIKDDQLSVIEQCLKMNSRSLLEKHSNLEMISASAYHSQKNGENICYEPCIVLYCSCKGVIPYEEEKFPEDINGIKTDVREGFFYLFPNDGIFKRASDVLDRLMMGASIGKKDENMGGTLGGFVTLKTGEMGFITCSHVLCDFSTDRSPRTTAFEVVQPSYIFGNTNHVCGVNVKSILQNVQGVTVDASVVKLTDRLPEHDHFTELFREDLLEAGFSLENIPKYSTGATRDYSNNTEHTQRTNLCIKSGVRSGLTKGSLCLNGMAARPRNISSSVSSSSSEYLVDYLSQLEIAPIPPKQFAVPGDSGALVFQVDTRNRTEENDHLFCIGMVVGGTSHFSVVVTPIEPILQSLNVEMYAFSQEAMDH